MENNFTPELIAKARQEKSPEALLALAEANNITLTQDEARDYFAQLHEQCNQSGELSDDELDNVSGGGCYYGDGRLVVTLAYYCKRYRCNLCNQEFSPGVLDSHWCIRGSVSSNCSTCVYKSNKGMRMLCNHPDNYKK
ncbi:MAG: hypothetical protein K2H29_00475 [Oscillospiraceae bacterium]|nr:hypothetical protein [Oscillospiraceae bacterium]